MEPSVQAAGLRAGEDRRRCVVIVEDNPTDRLFLEHELELQAREFELKAMDRGERALAHLIASGMQGAVPVMVILDLNLPGLDGEGLLARIRQDPTLCGLPVIIWTVSDDPGTERRVRGLGVQGYFVKPPDHRGYRAVISEMVAAARQALS